MYATNGFGFLGTSLGVLGRDSNQEKVRCKKEELMLVETSPLEMAGRNLLTKISLVFLLFRALLAFTCLQ